MITYKGETLFKLDKDGHYILCYISSDITLYYVILYYWPLNYYMLKDYKPVVTGFLSYNCIEY